MDTARAVGALVVLVVGVGVVLLLFLLLRTVALWYWRVSEGIEALKSIDKRLAILVQLEVEKRQG